MRYFSTLAVSIVALTACSSTPDTTMERSFVSPSYTSLQELVRPAELIVSGSVGRGQGAYPIVGNEPFAYNVWDVEVESVLARTRTANVEPGQTISVGMFSTNGEADEGGELSDDVGSFSHPLIEGTELVLVLAPFTFSESEVGWVAVGSDYGVYERDNDSFRSRAPEGDMKGGVYVLADFEAVSDLIGTEAPAATDTPPTSEIPDDAPITPTTIASKG